MAGKVTVHVYIKKKRDGKDVRKNVFRPFKYYNVNYYNYFYYVSHINCKKSLFYLCNFRNQMCVESVSNKSHLVVRGQMCPESVFVVVSLPATRTGITAFVIYAAQKSVPKGKVVCDVLHINLVLVGLLQLFLTHRVSDNVPFQIVRSRKRSSISRTCRIRTALRSIVSRAEERDKILKLNFLHS